MRTRLAAVGGARLGAVAVALAALASTVASAAAPVTPTLRVTVTPGELTYGAGVTVTGSLLGAGNGVGAAPLALQADPYPFRGFATVARTITAADGSFSFVAIQPDRDTRLRVILQGSPATASPQLPVTVDPGVAINARSLGPGQTRLSLRVRHTPQGGSASVSAWWFVAARGTRLFRLATVTSTRTLAPGLTYASAIIDPPSRRFLYRVCINPPWERAMGPAASHRPCPQNAFTVGAAASSLAYQGEGRGIPAPAYPSAGAIAAARSFLDARAGQTSFAVVNSSGQLSGVREHEHFQTASVVKVMMLVAYLQMLNARHRGLHAADTALLYPMIHISDNEAASAVLAVVGDAALARVARQSGMTDYAPAVGWWAYTQSSAADQARFFFALERLIPPQFYGYARALLSGIEPSQSWGVPPVARPRWQVFFKTGALPSEGLFNEVARLERPGVRFTVAVFTDGDPSMGYGEQTIEGLASVLLAHSP